MTTLLLTDNFPPRTGGSGRWFWELYRRLEPERYVIAAGEAPRQEDFDRGHRLRVRRMPLTQADWGVRSLIGLRGYWRSFQAVRRLVVEENIRQLHCGRCLPEGWVGWLLKQWQRLPYVCYIHGEEMNFAADSRELTWLIRRVLCDAEFVIVNSRNTARIVREDWLLPPRRVRLLHPGVDTRRLMPAGRDEAVRRQLGWGERPVVLTVGRLQLRKGHDQMILALQAIRQAIPDVLYAIVGDGEERKRLEEMVVQGRLQEHVRFHGEPGDEELIHCYQQCDLFVLPNRQIGGDIEGFGMVLLEAQACGKPVVAGASGGTAETMRIPQSGLVVPCETPERLAATVSELLADAERRQRMGRAGRAWVVEQFDWEALARQAKDIFGTSARASRAAC